MWQLSILLLFWYSRDIRIRDSAFCWQRGQVRVSPEEQVIKERFMIVIYLMQVDDKFIDMTSLLTRTVQQKHPEEMRNIKYSLWR
jgi:hypothetical protein